MADVKHRIISKPSKEKLPRATSENDWILQELAEGKPIPATGDSINDAVGRGVYQARASYAEWISPTTKRRFNVLRYYWGDPKLVIDKPANEKEQAEREKFFGHSDITYVAVAPGESLAPEELRSRIREKLLETAKRMKPPKVAVGAGAAAAPETTKAKATKPAKKKATKKSRR